MNRALCLAVVFAFAAVACSAGSTPLPAGRGTAEVNGAAFSYWCEGSGSPTVIIEQGLFDGVVLPDISPEDWWEGWATPILGISEFTHVCVYNRRGLPGSEPLESGIARTSQDHVDDLRGLIEELGFHPPFVMVGHSFGGLNLQLFTSQHPDLVAGLVLVDSTHPRGSQMFDFRGRNVFPPEWVDVLESEDRVSTVSDLGDIPLIVLSQGQYTSMTESEAQSWADLQEDLAMLSTNSEHILLADSGHFVPLDRPDAIVAAVATILRQLGEL